MIFYVPNNDEINCFVEQKSVTNDRQSFVKLTKYDDIAKRHSATRGTHNMG